MIKWVACVTLAMVLPSGLPPGRAQEPHLDAISDIIEDLQHGRMIVLVDDERRENEGDLVCAAEFITPQTINFMLREGRGMLCVPLAGEICDLLGLEPQGHINTTQHSTAYTVSVDAHHRFGVSTGVSAADRANTVKLLSDPSATASDLARPGHVQPLRCRNGGVLVRAGQTEGSVDLCSLAGLRPAAAIIEIMNEDGTMARRPQLEKLCKKYQLKMCSVADVIQYRLQRQQLVERVDDIPFENECGRFRLVAYRSAVDPLPHVAMVCGEVGRLDQDNHPVEINDPVLVRMHSQNLLGDVFGDLTQPTGSMLRNAMAMIYREGRGVVVYLRHEKMGTGLLRRLQTRYLPDGQQQHEDGPDIGRPQFMPGMMPPADKGAYGIGSQILRDLGIRRMRLITNHPFTPTALSGFGLEISEFVPAATGS